MKAIVIASTVIANKQQALSLVRRLNGYFDGTYEMSLVIDDYIERLVNAGFLTWEEAESAY